MADTYHHGNLRSQILERALAIIADEGIEAMSLRAVATELGVSHAAPRHHFPSRQALLTAIAADGYTELGDRTAAVREAGGSFLDIGRAYIGFALEHPAAFTVMFEPTACDQSDPALDAASTRALGLLRASAEIHHPDADAAALAGWSLMHGFAVLARSGALRAAGFVDADTDLVALAGRAAALVQAGDA